MIDESLVFYATVTRAFREMSPPGRFLFESFVSSSTTIRLWVARAQTLRRRSRGTPAEA
jgi:hypothetical protein